MAAGCFTTNGTFNASECRRHPDALTGRIWEQRLGQYAIANGIALMYVNPWSEDTWDWAPEDDNANLPAQQVWDAGLDKPFLRTCAAWVPARRRRAVVFAVPWLRAAARAHAPLAKARGHGCLAPHPPRLASAACPPGAFAAAPRPLTRACTWRVLTCAPDPCAPGKLFDSIHSGSYAKGVAAGTLNLGKLMVWGYSVGAQMVSWMMQVRTIGEHERCCVGLFRPALACTKRR